MGQHDLSYRLFFAHRRMIQDLLREIVGEQWVERIDFSFGEKVEASFVSARHESRESDVIWKFRRLDGGEPVYVYILLEFQSRPDPSMAVRFMGYVSLFYQNLMADQPGAGWRKLPPVIPVLVYNGSEPWNVATDLGSLIGDLDPSAEIYRPQLRYRLIDEATYPRDALAALKSPVADLFRIERSRDWSELRSGVRRLGQSVPRDEASLRRAFETWLQKVILPRFGLTQADSATLNLEEMDTMLAESIDRWNDALREKSREEGRQEGRQEGQEGEARLVLSLLRLKFGSLAPEVEDRVRSADPDRLLEWGERVLTAESLQVVFGEDEAP
ncbi:MAG TPA: Rpn family recombination-promoting nuclease/putative transposase [Thermoanaerobaculia bacterium]|nr:Rpn family recombination-promoting nuclease/putative transposase [Thermoanaerobaculia bacterium]